MYASEIERHPAGTLPANLKRELLGLLSASRSPYESIEDLLVSLHAVFGALPKEMLCEIFRFRADPSAYGSMLLENFPIDENLPQHQLMENEAGRNRHLSVKDAC
jgi:hypothetical protein